MRYRERPPRPVHQGVINGQPFWFQTFQPNVRTACGAVADFGTVWAGTQEQVTCPACLDAQPSVSGGR